MQTVVIVVHLMLVLSLIGAVLLQRSEGGGLTSGSNSGFLSSRGSANVLTRTTAFLAMGFFITSLALSVIAGWGHKPVVSILGGERPAGQQAPSGPPPLGESGGALDALRGAPAAPAAPSGPQAPQSR